MFKVPNQVYTAEFKTAAVQRVKDGQSVSPVARELSISTQTVRNWQGVRGRQAQLPRGDDRHV
ncbi:transposase-like protein [Paraburkholderia sp. MM5482-R2]